MYTVSKDYTGMRPVLAEYHFSPVHYDVILSTHKITNYNALARNSTRQALVARHYIGVKTHTLFIKSR